jgi:hypothetical protein
MDLLLGWRRWLAFRASRQPDNEDQCGQYPLTKHHRAFLL